MSTGNKLTTPKAALAKIDTGGEFNLDRKAASNDAMEGRQPAPRQSSTPPARPCDTMLHWRPRLLTSVLWTLAHRVAHPTLTGLPRKDQHGERLSRLVTKLLGLVWTAN
jgi:hypothetical protein